MDLIETGDHYVLRADLPGLSEKDVNIELDSDVLTISGQRNATRNDENGGYRRVERSYGSFSRSLTLPKGIDPEAVEASFEQGVLEVRIPKPEQVKPRKVTISVGAGSTATDTAEPDTAETDTGRDAGGCSLRAPHSKQPLSSQPPRGPRPARRGPRVALTDVMQLPLRALARARARMSAYKLRVRPGTDSFRAYQRWTLCLSACFWWLELGEVRAA